MGKAGRKRPVRLAEKLRHFRIALGLSQNELIRRMGMENELIQPDISSYEQDEREPTLMVLLEYARAAAGGTKGIADYLEILIDDKLNPPRHLPNPKPLKLTGRIQRKGFEKKKTKGS